MTTREKIMVVDDSALILDAIGAMLREAGYDVVTRSVPIGTGAAILRERPALVLMDVSMPLMTGDAISESLRSSSVSHDTVIVLHSDRAAAELEQLSRACGAAGFVRKGAERRELLAEVARFLALRRRGSVTAGGAKRAGLLVAASADTLVWAKHVLSPIVPVRCTDSGAEALRLIGGGGAPHAAILGTSLIDLSAARAWERAVKMDARWKRRIVVMDEIGGMPFEAPVGMARWSTSEPVRALLERLEIDQEGA